MGAEIGSINIALSADLQKLVADFNRAGGATETFGKRTERLTQQVDTNLGRTLGALRHRAEASTETLGLLGVGLRSFGPLGLAVGVGLAGGILALNAFDNKVKDTLKTLGNLHDQAQVSGLSTDAFQGLKNAALEAGVSADKFSEAMTKFAVNSEAAKEGSGELYNALRNVSQKLADDFRRATDQAERFKIVVEAASRISSDSGRAAFSRTAFGRGGIDMVRLLGDINQAGGFAGMIEGAKNAGAVIDSELIKRAERLGDELDRSSNIISTNMNSAFATLANSWGFGRLEKWAANLAISFRRGVEMAQPPADRSSDTLDWQIRNIEAFKQRLSTAIAEASDPSEVIRLTSALERARKQLDALLAARSAKARGELAAGLKSGVLTDPDDPNPNRPKITVTKNDPEVEAKIERDRLRERIAALGDLATAEEQSRLKELDLLDVTRHGSITQAEATRIVETHRTALEARIVAMRESLGVATEGERIAIKARQLDQDATLSITEKTKALELYKKQLAETVKNEQIRASEFPELTRLSLDAADLKGSLDRGLAGSLQGITSDLWNLAKGTTKAGEGFTQMALKMADAIAQAVLMKTVVGPLANILSSGLSSAFPGSSGVLPGGAPLGQGGIGANAEGTDYWKGGLTWVGEKGKELIFLPRGSKVVPNDKIRDAGKMAEFGEREFARSSGAGSRRMSDYAARTGISGVGITLNVHDRNNTSVESSQPRRSGGGFEIDVYLDKKGAKALRRPGSEMNNAMRDSFGIHETLVRR